MWGDLQAVGRETGSLLRLLKNTTHPPLLPVREVRSCQYQPTPACPWAGARKSEQKDQFPAAQDGMRPIFPMRSFIMAFVRVEQRNAHLAGAVRLNSVEGRYGPISKATLTAISNTRRDGRGEGDNRGEEATAIQWTL